LHFDHDCSSRNFLGEYFMVRFKFCLSAMLLMTAAVVAAPVTTLPIPGGYLDVSQYVGSGAKTAYYIIDFGGNGGGKVAYGFRFDSSTLVGIDGMNALDTQGPLNVTYDNFGTTVPNLFVNSLGIDNTLLFDEPDYNVDGRYWSLWSGVPGNGTIAWNFANTGLSGVDFLSGNVVDLLTDGEIYGFYAGNGSVQPGLPLAAIPEPSTWAMLMGVAALAIVRARRRRVS